MNKILNDIIKNIEIEYEHYPRIIIITFIALFYLLILIQSYYALPRNFSTVFIDTWEMLIFILPLIFIVLRPLSRKLLVFGSAFLLLGLTLAFLRLPSFIKPEYATISSLMGIWLLGDWSNFRAFKKSLLSELMKGNYYLAIGLFLSTFVLGSIIEILNAPSGLWLYRYPFPSVEFLGVPIFIAVFGWFPWILAMFSFFYPYALKRPKKL